MTSVLTLDRGERTVHDGHLRLLLPLLLAALLCVPVALGDTAPIENTPDLPWTNPDHTSNLEVLLGQIASHVANRTVTMHCEGETDWTNLAQVGNFDPHLEYGYVNAFFSRFGTVLRIDSLAELSGEAVCRPLKQFTTATTKQTKCRAMLYARKPVKIGKRVRQILMMHRGALGPCYQPDSKAFDDGGFGLPSELYWERYNAFAWAIWTVAHEAIHLGGIVGTTFANGATAGDPQAEAKADCYGMQWVPYVATQLGDTLDDGYEIARFLWDLEYPQVRLSSSSQYWSSDCRPGGALDVRPAGETHWP